MAHPSEQICTNEMSMFMGTVAAVKQRIMVRTDRSLMAMARATSCLIEPQVGDRVMYAVAANEQAFILAVLQRDERAALVLAGQADIVIESRSGAVKLRGREQIELSSEGSVETVAPNVRLQALKVSLNVVEAKFTGRSILATVGNLRVIASSIESFAESVVERFSRLIRHTSGTEQVLARNMQYRTEESFSLHGKNTIVTAEQLVRIDSEQIHIG